VAVVTGGGSGIGRACTQILSARGFTMAVLDIDHKGAIETTEGLTGPAMASALDVSSNADVRQVIGEISETYGRIDVLVTAAGHLDFAPLDAMPEATLDRMINVHLKGTIFAVQAVVPSMREQRYGRIVCISSIGARHGHAMASHYTAAKAGIVGFVNSACLELGPLGVTINSVLPGAIDTPMLAGRDPKATRSARESPVGGIGRPEDVAHAVAFLTSPESRYVSGASLVVSGGAYT
jgi:2-hydroxycyclohexanecarboxyl-CoA dehydrogenase